MPKPMWVILVVALLALVIALFSLYQIMRFTKAIFQSKDSFTTLVGTQAVPKIDDGTKKGGIEGMYIPVTGEELWENRGNLSGKKIELTTELDTDTMVLQPTPFLEPIELKKPDLIDANKDMWVRNQGKQRVVIQGTFYLHLAIGEDGRRVESYTLVVDRMAQKLDAKQFYIWPDKRTPTKEIDTKIFYSLDSETLKQLDGKPITYVGVYTVESGTGVLDGKLAVNLEKITDTSLLTKLSQGNMRVRVLGVLHLNLEQSKYSGSMEAGKIEVLDQK